MIKNIVKFSEKIQKTLDYFDFICYNIDRILYTEISYRHSNGDLTRRKNGTVCTT